MANKNRRILMRLTSRIALVSLLIGFGNTLAAQEQSPGPAVEAESPSAADLATAADGGHFYGMLRERDLTPFGFLRLDMRPAHALEIEPGTVAIEANLGYQNTWALSRDVEKYLTATEPAGRRRLGPADINAILSLPGENYLLDTEAATLDIGVHYKISGLWTVYGVLTAQSYQGGFMDSGIEQFHDSLGFSTFGRPALARDRTSVLINLKSAQVVLLDAPRTRDFTDPIFGVRYTGITLPGRWRMSVDAAIKVPLRGERMLFSTGRTDYGLQASVRRLGERNAVHLDLAAVWYAGESAPVPHEAQLIPTFIAGWEYKMTARTNLNLQAYASTSVYKRAQTDLDELLNPKFQASLGVRHQFDWGLVSFAITENLQNLNNTPDIGFQFGYAWAPRLKTQ
jgi:hypothetical protein